MQKEIKDILTGGSPSEKRGVFAFDLRTRVDVILKKFRVWSKYFFPEYFLDELGGVVEDAPFHTTMLQGYLMAYLGREDHFLNVSGRGLSKTSLVKLFMAFCVANDTTHFRKFFKILSKEADNARQITTDVYNMLIAVRPLYPEIFAKTEAKREERMESFTTATGIKMAADTVGTGQRGDIQEYARPDFICVDDFEDRNSIMSAVITKRIWNNLQEAKTGLSKEGAIVYLCNYISERGNVYKLIKLCTHKLIVPIAIKGKDGKWISTWNRFTPDDVERLEKEEDFEGEYLCNPSASADVFFDRDSLEKQVARNPIDMIAGLKIFHKYNPMHRIGSGHDVGGGVGLDHSTSVFIDFDVLPAQVVATYKSNEIRPDAFGYEIARQCKIFGENYCAPERNYGSTLDILKTVYPIQKIHLMVRDNQSTKLNEPKDYGWDTNAVTKPKMLIDLARAVENGIIDLNDQDLIDEALTYTRDDFMEKSIDPRLTTRHFDLLTACAIAFQMKDFVPKPVVKREQEYWMPDNPALKVIDASGRGKKSENVNPAA